MPCGKEKAVHDLIKARRSSRLIDPSRTVDMEILTTLREAVRWDFSCSINSGIARMEHRDEKG
jgi:hypothetical protein